MYSKDYSCCIQEKQYEVDFPYRFLGYNCEAMTNNSIPATSDNRTRKLNDLLSLTKTSQSHNESDKLYIQSNSFSTNGNPSRSSVSNEKVMNQSYQDLQALSSSQNDVSYICASELLSGFPDVSHIYLFDRFIFIGFCQV